MAGIVVIQPLRLASVGVECQVSGMLYDYTVGITSGGEGVNDIVVESRATIWKEVLKDFLIVLVFV